MIKLFKGNQEYQVVDGSSLYKELRAKGFVAEGEEQKEPDSKQLGKKVKKLEKEVKVLEETNNALETEKAALEVENAELKAAQQENGTDDTPEK